MHYYQQAYFDVAKFKHKSILDYLNAVLTYIEFFKSSMTDIELLTAIQDQMDKHTITKAFISDFNDVYVDRPYLIPGPVTLACVKLYGILTDLEDKCKHDLTNKQQ